MIPAGPGPHETGPEARAGFRLPGSSRVTSTRDIRQILRRGKRKRTSHLDVFIRPSPVSRPRLGLVVPKHRQRIVDRNRLKRRMRELGRIEVLPRLHAEGANVDVLFRARCEAYAARFDELKAQMVEATEFACSRKPCSD